jgi:hypothetical protein
MGANVTRSRISVFVLCSLVGMLLLELQIAGHAWEPANSKAPMPITDPIFGLPFDPAKVKYEPMPVKIRNVCQAFDGGDYWTFGRVKEDETEYFIVLGRSSSQDGDMFGTGLLINNSACREEESKWLLSGFVPSNGYVTNLSREPILPGEGAKRVCGNSPFADCHYILRSPAEEMVLRELIRDAIARAGSAWKNAGGFRKQVCSPSYLAEQTQMPVLKNELEKFCKE